MAYRFIIPVPPGTTAYGAGELLNLDLTPLGLRLTWARFDGHYRAEWLVECDAPGCDETWWSKQRPGRTTEPDGCADHRAEVLAAHRRAQARERQRTYRARRVASVPKDENNPRRRAIKERERLAAMTPAEVRAEEERMQALAEHLVAALTRGR